MQANEIVDKIISENEESAILERVDDQRSEYIDSDWDANGDYDDEYEWYIDHCNGEAEDDILNAVLKQFETKYGLAIAADDYLHIFDQLKSEWGL